MAKHPECTIPGAHYPHAFTVGGNTCFCQGLPVEARLPDGGQLSAMNAEQKIRAVALREAVGLVAFGDVVSIEDKGEVSNMIAATLSMADTFAEWITNGSVDVVDAEVLDA